MDNNGTNRKTADQVRLRYAPKTAYFFGDVESQCDQKYLEPYVRKILTDLEKQHRIVHTEAVQEAIDVQRNEGTVNNDLVLNPLIPFILGHTDQISSREILDYAEQQLNHGREHNKEVAFIDLCLILGNDGRARKYAERSKNQFDLLDILQKEHGTMPDQIMSKTLQMFNLTQDKPNDPKSDLLTQLIIRLIRSRETDIFPDVLTDLARASYPWDALCLASIMTPSKVDFIGEMKKCLRKQIPNNATLFWLDTAGELVKMKDQQAEKIKLKCDGIDPLTAYRIFKIHQHIFHKVDHDELSLQSWAFMAQPIMYKIIVGCLISSQPVLAEDIAQDAAQHIINRKNALWSVQAAPFETIVRMVVCMVTAMRLNNSLKADTIRRFLEVNHDLKSIQQNGIMNYVTSKWLALDLGKRLWQEVLYLPSIQNVTNSLLLVPILLQSNLTCLAVKIMYELASTSQPIPIGGFGQAIAAMAAELKFRPAMCTEIANALSLKFDHNPQSWVAVTEIDQTVESEHTKPAEEPSRFTGQSFVEKIKMTTSPELALENDTAIVADDAAKEESVSVEEESARAAVENKPGSEVPVEESPTVMLSVTEASPVIHTLALSERSDSLPKEQMHIVDPESFEEKQTDWTAVPKQKDANLKTPDMSCPSEDGQYTEESVIITSELADTVQTASAATSLDHLVNNTLQPNDVVEKPKDSTPNDFAVATSIDSKLPEEVDEQPKLTETVVEQPKGFSTGGWDVPDQSVPTQELAGFGTSSTRSAYDNRPTPRQYNDVGHHGPNSYGSGNAPRQSSYGSSYGCRPDRGGSGNMSNGRGGSYSGPRVSRGTRPRGSH